MIADALRRQIAERSLVSTGTAADWQRLLERKSISVGFMGGSVTQGFANGVILADAFPELICRELEQMGYAVTKSVCADAGMDTLTGNLLAERVILSQKPDLVFLEYAINDTTLRHSVLSFESLLRRLLTAEKPPLVCMILTRSAHGYSCDSYMEPVAAHYGMPCINLRYGLAPVLESGEMQWEDFADAESHPNPDGHRVIADAVLYLLEQGRKQSSPENTALPEPWLGAPFAAMEALLPNSDGGFVQTDAPVCPRQEYFFHSAWAVSEKTGAWTLSGTLSAVILYFESDNDPAYGRCRVLLDGEPVRNALLQDSVLETNSIYGWGNSRSILLLNGKDAMPHTLTLEPLSGTVYVLAAGICHKM